MWYYDNNGNLRIGTIYNSTYQGTSGTSGYGYVTYDTNTGLIISTPNIPDCLKPTLPKELFEIDFSG